MPTVEASVDIAATPATVDRVLCDIDAAPLWTAGLEYIEVVEGTPGQAGSVGHAHYRGGSKGYVVEDRLIEIEHGVHYRSEIRGGGMKATVETNLDEIPTGTRVTIRWNGTGTNPLTKLILALSRRRVRRRAGEDLEALRDLVERRFPMGQEPADRRLDD